ncbi:MAG: hypothetical protein KGH84_09335, partial [Paracoccaceae bacterium]|nr:hypothetical protein [Paracoccaceae bacterium]
GTIADVDVAPEAPEIPVESSATPESPEIQRAAEPAPQVVPQPVTTKRRGFVPLLLGGLIAGGIGYSAANTATLESWLRGTPLPTAIIASQLDAQASAIDSLKAELASANAAVASLDGKVANLSKVSDLGQTVSDLASKFSALQADVKAQDNALKQAMATLGSANAAGQTAASGSATLSEATAQQLRTLVDQQHTENLALAAQVKAASDQLSGRIDAAEKQAASATKTVQEAIALSRVRAAFDAGTPYAAPLAELTGFGVTVPDAIAARAASGVPSLRDLQAQFPAAAREGLAAALKAKMGGGWTDRLTTFLRVQTGVRSLTPHAGTDPDAILSRAQADLTTGRLTDVLSEVKALPDAGQAAMADWVSAAMARVNVGAALDALAITLNGK